MNYIQVLALVFVYTVFIAGMSIWTNRQHHMKFSWATFGMIWATPLLVLTVALGLIFWSVTGFLWLGTLAPPL